MVYWSFRKAREYVIKRNIKNKLDWENYCESEGFPEGNIPVNPENYYKKLGWKSFDHWIGFKLLPFKEFKKIITKNEIYKQSQYIDFYNKNLKEFSDRKLILPTEPQKEYNRNNWKGWEKLSNYFFYLNFVIKKNKTQIHIQYKKFHPNLNIKKFKFIKLRNYARSLGLSNQREWFLHFKDLIKDNDDDLEYKIENQKFFTNEQIDGYDSTKVGSIDELHLGTDTYTLLKNEGYANPARTFKNYGWKNWQDFLKSRNIKRNEKIWSNFNQARKYARKLGLKNRLAWEFHYKKNKGIFMMDNIKLNIPLRPDRIIFYKKEWIDWKNFLNQEKK